ncbi:hypothetical protein SAMN04487967_0677 [Natronorubrum sediminis]|uniref:Ig-like domain-containing protein n=1 Tax=Natronorubrum sediminis TaxID=640943 RepID=A0A1H6FML1_9EURY|nr:hypothetical protein [Natronorubrum sediminis]SEH12149.1 hypothetical protein SAMN04487967_0677 [Natronorubrum sediminis]
MDRRSLLACLSCSTLAVSGCLSVSGSPSSDESTVDLPSDPDDPVARSVIGSTAESPHRVRVWNLDDDRHTVELRIESDDGSAVTGTYTLESEAHVAVFLGDEAEYEVSVAVDDTDLEAPDIDASSFDDPCPATELVVLGPDDLEVTEESDADHC